MENECGTDMPWMVYEHAFRIFPRRLTSGGITWIKRVYAVHKFNSSGDFIKTDIVSHDELVSLKLKNQNLVSRRVVEMEAKESNM